MHMEQSAIVSSRLMSSKKVIAFLLVVVPQRAMDMMVHLQLENGHMAFAPIPQCSKDSMFGSVHQLAKQMGDSWWK